MRNNATVFETIDQIDFIVTQHNLYDGLFDQRIKLN